MIEQVKRYFLAIDQGGHASRALVFDQSGSLQAEAFAEIETRENGLFVEHDPEALVESVQQALSDCVSKLGRDAKFIEAAGLATQRSSMVCWDKYSEVALSPVISWQDRRAQQALASMQLDVAAIHSRTGLFPNPHYGASKMRWCLENLPAVSQAAKKGSLAMGPLSSFLLFRLLRQRPFVVDPANASRTLLMQRATCQWDAEILQGFALQQTYLPKIVGTRSDFGTLDIAGLRIPLTVCTGDQSAALFAFGMPKKDALWINAGTGAFVQRRISSEDEVPQRLLRSVVYRDDKRLIEVLEGTVNGAARAFHWWAEEQSVENWQQQLADALKSELTPPIFINAVSGVGSPFWLSDCASYFVGDATNDEKLVAILESIVFLLVSNCRLMQAPPIDKITLSGGLSQLDGFCQLLANLSGLPVERPESVESTGRGLAYLVANESMHLVEQSQKQFFAVENALLNQRFDQWQQLMRQISRKNTNAQ